MKDEEKSKEEFPAESRSAHGALAGRAERNESEDTPAASIPRGDFLSRAVLDDLTVLVARFKPDGTLTFANDAYCRFFGVNREDPPGLTFPHRLSEDDQGNSDVFRDASVREDTTKTFERREVDAAGAFRWIEWTCRAFRNESGQIAGFQAAGWDITHRKLIEEDLRQSEERFRTLAETAAVGIYIQRGGTVFYANPAMQAITGYSEEDLKEIDIFELVHPDFRDTVHGYAERRLSGGEAPPRYECKIVTKQREERWVEIFAELIEYKGKTSAIGSIFDITDRKQAELALAGSEASVRNKLQAIMEPDGDLRALNLADIIDTRALQTMMEDFYRITRVACSILDHSGRVQVAAGWQDICRKFHRVHPDTLANCLESDVILTGGVSMGTFKEYRCKNNLRGMVTPIEVGGKHVGNLFLGQYFYEDEIIDYELFRTRARRYGFDEGEYLSALDRVPRWNQETARAAMTICARLAGMVSSLSYSAIKLSRALAQQETTLRRLSESEERYQRITDSITDYIYTVRVKDGQAAETTHSPGCLAVTGYRAEEFTRAPYLWIDIVFPEDRPEVEKRARQLLTGEAPPSFEHRIVHKNGSVRWVSNTFAPHRDERGVLVAYDGLIQDITTRKGAEEALAESEKRYRLIAENIQDVFWMATPGLERMVYVSPAYERIWGRNIENLYASPESYIEAVHPEDRDRAREVSVTSASRGNAWSSTYRVVRPDGSIRWVEERGFPLSDARGGWYLTIGVVTDVTDRKQAELEREKFEAQLRQAHKLEAIGTLAGGIAHDFNNILAPIIGYSEMAMEDAPHNSPMRSDLEQVIKAAHRARELVRQILIFSRRSDDVDRVPMDLGTTVTEVLKLLRASIPSTIEITQDIGKGMVLADPTQMHQVLLNLCTNASHALEDRGTLHVSLTEAELGERDNRSFAIKVPRPGKYFKVSVSDTGCGMNAETMQRIFDPYFTTKEVGKGSGLGLAVVHGIVKRHEGALRIRSEPGRGSTFDVFIPGIEAKEDGWRGRTKSRPGGKESILIVDDEEMLATLTGKILAQLGYVITTKTSALEALAAFRTSPDDFDLIITDYTMPQLTGTELAGRILEIRPDMPIILCTGHSERVTETTAEEMGIARFALKPLDRSQLAELVRSVLDEKNG